MTNFLLKVQDLREKMIYEFNSFKSCHHNQMDQHFSKNLDDLFSKVKYQMQQLENGILSAVQEEDSKSALGFSHQNTDVLIKSQTLATLTELKEKIIREFHTATATDQFGSKEFDIFVFNVGYQIEQMKNEILAGKNEDLTNEIKDIENRKAEALIKLQTLAASVTCSIINLDNTM